jgi:hypothetical protein
MKVRVELEVDLSTGTYDVKFHNLSRPGDDIDLERVNRVVMRVLDNVVVKTNETATRTPRFDKSMVN